MVDPTQVLSGLGLVQSPMGAAIIDAPIVICGNRDASQGGRFRMSNELIEVPEAKGDEDQLNFGCNLAIRVRRMEVHPTKLYASRCPQAVPTVGHVG